MAQVGMTLVGKEGTTFGRWTVAFTGRIPDLVTRSGRIFTLRRLSSDKTTATYYEGELYDLNGTPQDQ